MNESHQRHLLVTFRHIDRLLSETEHILNSADSPSPFQEYVQDSTPVQRKVAHEHILRVRETMQRMLNDLKIPLKPPGIGALWAAHNHLAFASLAAIELEAKQMKGYGELSDDEQKVFDRISEELCEPLDRLAHYFAHGKEASLPIETKSTDD
ncbi:MAG TPA: hypothetical protein VHG71_01830 [Verrucomicrobiae bacterium]|nr:hypothetical protein [Verrucomicrobiae bacterium]